MIVARTKKRKQKRIKPSLQLDQLKIKIKQS